MIERKHLGKFILLVSCFALWGLLNNMTDNLVPAFQKIFGTSQATAGYVQISFYGSYSVIALFASLLIQKMGYRVGVLVGLGVYIMGALLYIPACIAESFWTYIAGIFVVAGGCAVLETTCNPYVLALGERASAVRRLNFAQMFNPLGSLAGILLAQQLILGHIEESRRVALAWVCVPYVGLCAIAAAIWLAFLRAKPDDGDRVEEEKVDVREVLAVLFRSPRWYLGVVAQVFYVGVQIAAWTWMNVYCVKELGVTPKTAASYYLAAICCFIACRFLATYLMKWMNPARLMAVFAAGAIACSFGVMYVPTRVFATIAGLPVAWNVVCLVAMSGFMSLMFPTIYGIALDGIDRKAYKIGAAGLIMAIVGGALLTPWMASIIGGENTIWCALVPMFDTVRDEALRLSQASLRASFIVPAICFSVVFLYAVTFMKKGEGHA